MTLDKLFLKNEHEIKKYYDTELLANLLLLNYEFSNNKYLGITSDDIFRNIHKTIYSKSEIKEIKDNAVILLKIKYNIKVNDLETLDFESIG